MFLFVTGKSHLKLWKFNSYPQESIILSLIFMILMTFLLYKQRKWHKVETCILIDTLYIFYHTRKPAQTPTQTSQNILTSFSFNGTFNFITSNLPQKGLVYFLYTLFASMLIRNTVVCINYLYDNLNIYIFVYMQEYTFSFDHSYFWDTKTVSMQSII